MKLQSDIEQFLKQKGAEIIKFVDISHLPEKLNKGLPHAILFGIPLSTEFIKKVISTPNYVQQLIENNKTEEDEFSNTEHKTDQLADELADYLKSLHYDSFSQSENNLDQKGDYNSTQKSTTLPHKTIASLAGLGWIGKNNLLVTREYGCALSMCSVLTNAPLQTEKHEPKPCMCKECNICQKSCNEDSLYGTSWNSNLHRDDIVNVYTCTTCLMCMVSCPYTRKYAKCYRTIGVGKYGNPDIPEE